MAARTRKIRHDDETRAKIKTSQLINRLTGHVLGTVDMQTTQVTAALGLLKKTLPDLAAIAHTGADGGPIQHEDVNARDELLSRIGVTAARLGANGGSQKLN